MICTLSTISILPVVSNCLMCCCTKVVDQVCLKTIRTAESLRATVQSIKKEVRKALRSLDGRMRSRESHGRDINH